jgi:transposase
MIQAAKTLKRHLANLPTYFKHRITNATSEGINSKIQMIKLMACGYLLPLRWSRSLSSTATHVISRPQDVVATHTKAGSG